MQKSHNEGVLSLKEGILEIEKWTPQFINDQLTDLLDSQPYLMGTLMEADEGIDEQAHQWMLKAALVLRWSFQKMGWRLTLLPQEKWHNLLEEKVALYEEHQEENGLDMPALIKLSSSPNTLSELFLYVVENNPVDQEAAGNLLFLMDCMVEGLEQAVLQDKNAEN